jgi:hypothetical protein
MNELDLGRLLNTARRGGEISYERLSKACGGTPSAKRLHQLENGPLKNFPDPDTIRALAAGTGFSITEIIHASARSLRLPVVSEDPDVIRIHGLSTTPPRVAELFRDLGREIVSLAEKEVVGNADHPAPMNRAGESPADKRHLSVVTDYSEMEAEDYEHLAAFEGDPNIGPDELPHET